MAEKNIPRVMLTAAASGSGKTTVTCGLLQLLMNRRLRVRACKCGPDYIDPMFHAKVMGVPCRNLDLFFTDANTSRYLLAKNCANSDIVLIEGGMGYYDGIGATAQASSYELARATATPAVLIVNCKGMALSILSLIQGFCHYRQDSGIKAVILNHVSALLYPELKERIESELGLRVLGFVPNMPDCLLESRHLGLVTAGEVANLQEKLQRMAQRLEQTVDVEGLLALAQTAPSLSYKPPVIPQLPLIPHGKAVTVAVAYDKAFCFYYQDSLDLLQEMGAQLEPFSPLQDQALPKDCQGLLLGGGYPELYAAQLAANKALRREIGQQVAGGLPTIAECGGFMYLLEELEDDRGSIHKMVGVIPGSSRKTGRLQRFGYVTLTAQGDNLLCAAGGKLPAHEFHYWDSSHNGSSFLATKPVRGTRWPCVHGNGNLYAGYPHIYFYSQPDCAYNFLRRCAQYGRRVAR